MNSFSEVALRSLPTFGGLGVASKLYRVMSGEVQADPGHKYSSRMVLKVKNRAAEAKLYFCEKGI